MALPPLRLHFLAQRGLLHQPDLMRGPKMHTPTHVAIVQRADWLVSMREAFLDAPVQDGK